MTSGLPDSRLTKGGMYDIEFEEATIQLFGKVKLGSVICVYSDLTEGELFDAPEKVRNFFKELPKENPEADQVTDEAIKPANNYIAENVACKTSFDDCVHIALVPCIMR